MAVLVLGVTMLVGGKPASVKNDLVFLTRDGCVNTRCRPSPSRVDESTEAEFRLPMSLRRRSPKCVRSDRSQDRPESTTTRLSTLAPSR